MDGHCGCGYVGAGVFDRQLCQQGQPAVRHTGIRRIEICANRVTPEGYLQYDIFTDPIAIEKEKSLQRAILDVKKRYGKNAIMRGANLLECSTYRERNNQIGGHRA